MMKTAAVARWCTAIVLLFFLATTSRPIQGRKLRQLGTHLPRGGALLDGVSTALEQIMSNSTTMQDSSIPTPRKKNRFILFRIFRRKKRQTPARLKLKKKKNQTATIFTLKMNEKLEEARRTFLDRMAAVSFTLINQERDAIVVNNDTFFQLDGDDDDITPQSDLSLPNRSIFVVTTAALPWRTGTAVNPLLRAAYLSRKMKEINIHTNATSSDRMVTLVIPWLELEEDRLELYGNNHNFSTSQEQEDYIRDWLRGANMNEEADLDNGLRILFYPARYHSGLKSIFAMGDICATIRNQTEGSCLSDAVCVLEEPEHLNWYRCPGEGWTKVFGFVVGIVHTNYVEYASGQFHGLWTAPAIQVMSSAMIRAYCHKVIKLSGVLQTYAPEKECCENVHGVREDFIQEGRRRALAASSLNRTNSASSALNEEVEGQVYFIGKILWAKGFELMLQLQEFYYECTGKYFAIDVYGSGPEEGEIKRAFHGRKNSGKVDSDGGESDSDSEDTLFQENLRKLKSIEVPKSLYEWRRKPIPANFCGPVDHSLLGKYKTFVNPSTSEVLCTTTFEALAMGKFVIIPVHESNKFFLQFPNCLGYRNKWEFAANLRWALTHEPEPLTPELAEEFTWEAATDRLIRSSAITRREAKERYNLGKAKLDERIAYFHRELGKHDTLRRVLGGGPVSYQVKYELERQGLDQDYSEKFLSSSFVRAIKSSFISTNHQSEAA
jgi:digalactosyldiacylglycerol synthase